ncbi:hypothetical protein B0T20DRAFT_474301 [Sordaria brevicollis]|uniref:Uncharacterized protein n=1 Tax=Sordaria brevicollis TaxID=83679 RepID=A0AAE0PMK5_SORBR|nr:hypothetical protein B0T20DRAFT_474301 [Sordaria brevicollis]
MNIKSDTDYPRLPSNGSALTHSSYNPSWPRKPSIPLPLGNSDSETSGLSQSSNSVDTNSSSHTEFSEISSQNATDESEGLDDALEDRGGRVTRWEYPYSVAAQIMFLPWYARKVKLPPKESGLQAWGSNGDWLNKEGYGHPVLVLTDPDDHGYVVFQTMTSFSSQTLAQKFPGVSRAKLKASFMEIHAGTLERDLDAGGLLFLAPQPEQPPGTCVNLWKIEREALLRKRSYVDTQVSYRCKKEILLPYHYDKPSLRHKKYFLHSASYWRILDRILLLRVNGGGPEEDPLPPPDSFMSSPLNRGEGWESIVIPEPEDH